MKKLTPLFMALFLAACSGVDADWPMEDAGSSADVSQPDTSTPPPDNGDPGGCDYTNPNVDCDGDKCIGPADCDPYNADTYDGAPELCTDSVDNDCDGQVNEGCTTTPPPTGGGSGCVDSDGDGYCAATGPLDCNDQNNKVKPGVAEDCSTTYDDNCNGQANEGCPGVTPPPTNGDSLTIVADYPFAVDRRLSAQVAKTSGQLGGWWDKEVPSSGTSLTMELSNVSADACWLRLNVAQDNVRWLCMGNGSTATLDPDAGVGIAFKGKNYTKSDLMVWSAPGGTAAGCSALLKLKPECSL